jgi:hypothetical protein
VVWTTTLTLMTTTTKCIDDLLRIARVANDIAALLDELYGIDEKLGYDFFAANTRERMGARNEGDEALKKFLAGIPLAHLERIHALMYAGRDNESPVVVKDDFLKRGESRSDMERSVAEKRPALRTYFDKALKRVRADGIDLDTF